MDWHGVRERGSMQLVEGNGETNLILGKQQGAVQRCSHRPHSSQTVTGHRLAAS